MFLAQSETDTLIVRLPGNKERYRQNGNLCGTSSGASSGTSGGTSSGTSMESL